MRILLVFFALTLSACAQTIDLAAIHKVFIDKMDNDLDQLLKAGISRQMDGKVTVVSERGDADAILTGASKNEAGTFSKSTVRFLGLRDLTTGSVRLLDKNGHILIWSGEAGDRNRWADKREPGGQQKVASRLIRKWKEDMSARAQ